ELHYHAERGNENLSRTPIPLTPQNRHVTQSVTNCITTRSVGTIIKILVTANEVLFNHDGTDDAECDVSDG
ncbi:hypothetical protein, partial [Pseudomonas syringae group genomosp. 7]|uniref:hypothetical protein n=1 Tax=Pseudomonas syringae group genomosp. 7 TaxID=251699 RepID=UPI00376F9C32